MVLLRTQPSYRRDRNAPGKRDFSMLELRYDLIPHGLQT